MWSDKSLSARIRSLAAFQVFATQRALTAEFEPDDAKATGAKLDVIAFSIGSEIIAQSLGLEISNSDILPVGGDVDDYADLIVNGVAANPFLPRLIGDYFGKSASAHFTLTRSVAAVLALAAMFREPMMWTRLPHARRAHLIKQRTIAVAACKAIGDGAFGDWPITTTFAFEEPATDAISALVTVLRGRRWGASTFAGAFDAAVRAMSTLVPHFPDVDEQLARTRAIVGELKACAPGDADWRRYEEVCLKALRMLFVPPFHKVSVQRYTHRRDERRDAVLSNTVHDGFWNAVRTDLDCRHVICELKNLKRLGKSDLRQIREYLRKPTIGRLGLIFHRKTAGASARLARHIAYADDRAVILLIDDITLSRLLLTRVFLGSADYALQDLKLEFELRY